MSARSRWLLWSWVGVVAIATLWIFIAAGGSHPRDSNYFFFFMMALPPLFSGLGAVIATKQPGNRVAWIFLALGLTLLGMTWADSNVTWMAPVDPTIGDALAVIWYNAGFFVALLPLFGLLLHIFPTGEYLSRRWAWAGWAAIITASTAFLAEASVMEVSPNFPPGVESWAIPNPIGFAETGTMSHPVYSLILGLTFLPLIFGGIASMVLRYRRSGLVVRAQIRWVALALLIFMVFGALLSVFTGYYGVNLFTIALVPVSMTIAITRYRLFDIDRLISRTVGYAIVVGALALVFALVVVVPGLVLGGVGEDGSAQEAPPILVAASTLAVAALFNPLRRRVLNWVDRRFNRSRYDAEKIVDGMASRLQDGAGVDVILDQTVDVLVETMQPAVVGAWVRR